MQDPIAASKQFREDYGMISVLLPPGEFTFRDLCVANPQVLPLQILRYLTRQVAEGKIVKHRPMPNTRPIYYQLAEPATSREIEVQAAVS